MLVLLVLVLGAVFYAWSAGSLDRSLGRPLDGLRGAVGVVQGVWGR
jgi:hypothetical protein